MSGFVLHPQALADLSEIWQYIAVDSASSADRVLDEIEEAVRTLVSFPLAGHTRSEITSRPIRFHPVREYLVAYAPNEVPLLVLAVVHGRRHPRIIASLLRERE
jgi:plasmid stabilization system protein ParE